jgi:hypothetical protein
MKLAGKGETGELQKQTFVVLAYYSDKTKATTAARSAADKALKLFRAVVA